ncbi:MAG: histidine--tRNA ligase [Candidatus Parcubacteria bacterium]|nr:MAG: histidine--tRNA ligase [Candidatus Parcubacteria bacterium]
MKFKIVLQRPRGMNDLLFEESDFFLNLKNEVIKHSQLYSFNYIQTPALEDEKVFTSSLGDSSDVVEKEMFYIKEKDGGSKYVLKPEGTASIMRAYLQNGMHSLPQPVKLFYFDRMYRREKPQLGRFREHTQWGLEIIGSSDPIYDAQIIQVFDRFFKKTFKLKDYIFKINSLGCKKDRKSYIKDLKNYYRKNLKNICKDCQNRYKKNPLRLLDCKNENDQIYKKNAPNLINYLCKECENHISKVLEYLDILEIKYEIDHLLVRGFDYYTKTVFEIFFIESNKAIGGGGRYDDLAQYLGSKNIPAVGGAIGIERLTEILKIHNVNLRKNKKPEVFIAQTTDKTKEYALKIYDELIRNNIIVAENFGKGNLSSQLELANKLGIKYFLIVGHQEIGNKTIILKDMIKRSQDIIPVNNIVSEIKKRLKL